MVIIGDTIKFDPLYHITGFCSNDYRGNVVTGTVVMVNYANKWFSVEYECGGKKLRTSFKFSQIGKEVKICD